jgi:hypothetical protein
MPGFMRFINFVSLNFLLIYSFVKQVRFFESPIPYNQPGFPWQMIFGVLIAFNFIGLAIRLQGMA